MNIEHRHGFADDEAKTRVQALADYMSTKHGMQVQWLGSDSFRMQGKYKVVGIDATIQLSPGKIAVTGKDPGMLWRGPAKAYIAKKLEQYMDPAVPPNELRRG
ncbi:MAG: polyhydroxyalkanoic acid system family protein [Polyangiales bacterium]